jgi:hypothetical protein
MIGNPGIKRRIVMAVSVYFGNLFKALAPVEQIEGRSVPSIPLVLRPRDASKYTV